MGGCIIDYYDPPIGPPCGNGFIGGTEQCDDGNTVDGDGCSATCEQELGWQCLNTPSYCFTSCGDGVRAPTEQCDGQDLAGESCASLGRPAGELRCGADCSLDISGCFAEMVLETLSASPLWGPPGVSNSGDALYWVLDGSEVRRDAPVLDLSDNTSTAVIQIRSTDAFDGLTLLELTGLSIRTLDLGATHQLQSLTVTRNPDLELLDLSALPQLRQAVLAHNSLLTIEISQCPLLRQLLLNGNRLLASDLDRVTTDLADHGLSNGQLALGANDGSLTSAAYTAYETLVSRGWTIDVPSPPPP